jgi:hypothetical protein
LFVDGLAHAARVEGEFLVLDSLPSGLHRLANNNTQL